MPKRIEMFPTSYRRREVDNKNAKLISFYKSQGEYKEEI